MKGALFWLFLALVVAIILYYGFLLAGGDPNTMPWP